MEAIQVVLPHQATEDGGRLSVVVHPVSGRDEEFMLEKGSMLDPCRRTTALLARCVRDTQGRLHGVEPIRELVVGDREILLLELQRLTFGNRLSCLARCPQTHCASSMDLELTVADLLQRRVPSKETHLEAWAACGGRKWRAEFRLPTVADIDHAVELATQSLNHAYTTVLQRCVHTVWCDADLADLERAPLELVNAIEDQIIEADPYAETLVGTSCPECGLEFQVAFDPGAYLFQELGGRQRRLFEDVHQLAVHYHWSEADILSMPMPRRKLYLELLDATEEWQA